ncbi:GPI mannosyltransferase 1 [Astyanax mexicanus]|uniref:GPI alpha-1,4-mannosyltransferase I, catalytic subunit n=1 Tax=Astyanax mexicanus TaxID=7994 RepID=A0A8T2MJ84_ASTMX|nr:GPI mannosyltransferase 1 [Astyanax mexicanus]KAG9283577.1 GPI mannosyltransferase 1 [Astyanax mexicanus]
MALTAERFIFRLLNFWVLHSLALVIRLFLVGYGIYQDKTMVVKYTDIDYHVFTDAARFVTQGESPYNRSTYRYTPLLAWILVPNIYVTPHFGKLLFVTCDVLSGVLLYRILSLQGLSSNAAGCFSAVWLLNPLPIGVSTRGSAEAVLSLLVLSTLLCLELKRLFMAAFFYALSVHMKIYPVTYALPIALYISSRGSLEGKGRSLFRILRGLFNKNVVMFAAVAGVVFLALTIAFYYMYGWDFLHETYLYHLTRRDIRHNFSPYFYMMYLSVESEWSLVLGLVSFLPQLLLLLLTSVAFYADLPFCCFLNTAIFVSFNKVCTSQYFLWYLCLLPLVLPRLRLSIKQGAGLLLLWFIGQGLWLMPAYYLEFEGHNTFVYIWLAGLLFLFINSFVMVQIISHYTPRTFHQTKKTE